MYICDLKAIVPSLLTRIAACGHCSRRDNATHQQDTQFGLPVAQVPPACEERPGPILLPEEREAFLVSEGAQAIPVREIATANSVGWLPVEGYDEGNEAGDATIAID